MKGNPLMKLVLFPSVHVELLICFSEEPHVLFFFSLIQSFGISYLLDRQTSGTGVCVSPGWLLLPGGGF